MGRVGVLVGERVGNEEGAFVVDMTVGDDVGRIVAPGAPGAKMVGTQVGDALVDVLVGEAVGGIDFGGGRGGDGEGGGGDGGHQPPAGSNMTCTVHELDSLLGGWSPATSCTSSVCV